MKERKKNELTPPAQTEGKKSRKAIRAEEEKREQDFSQSMSDAFKQKDEKRFFFAILGIVAVVVVLLVAAFADLIVLCFQYGKWAGYAATGVAVVLVLLFIIRPVCKVLSARFFITDVTSDSLSVIKRKNYRALCGVSKALVEYHETPANARFQYISSENIKLIKTALKGEKKELKAVMKKVYATDVAKKANSVIFKSAGKVFMTTSVSQNDKIDALSVLLVNLSLIKQIVGIYGYRPSFEKLLRIYVKVLRNALIAYGMQNVNWSNVFGKFLSGLTNKIPLLNTVVDGAVQGTVSAFLTILVGYKTKKYLCSDYKKQEKLDFDEEGVDVGDEEVEIASALARAIRKDKEGALDEVAPTEG